MAWSSSCTCVFEAVVRWVAHHSGWNTMVVCESVGTKARRCPPTSPGMGRMLTGSVSWVGRPGRAERSSARLDDEAEQALRLLESTGLSRSEPV